MTARSIPVWATTHAWDGDEVVDPVCKVIVEGELAAAQ
jgi:hypothetical protein